MEYNGYTFPVFKVLDWKEISDLKTALGALKINKLNKENRVELNRDDEFLYYVKKFSGGYYISRLILKREKMAWQT